MDDVELKDFLKRYEGSEAGVYKDSKGIPTVGVGSNLNSPEVPKLLESLGTSRQEILSGKQLSPEQSDTLLDKQLEEKKRYYNNIQKRDFPNSDIQEHERRALDSLMFQNPSLVGPKLRGYLENNDDIGAAKEILLNSNKNNSGGVAKRRLGEAKMFSGDRFSELVESLSDQEVQQIYSMVNSIKNPYTRQQVLDEYPFLKQIVKPTRFKNIIGK